MNFLKISDICLDDGSWANNIFITIDVDWASDYVLYDTLEMLQQFEIAATIMLTHQTDLIDNIESNCLLELGLHPNFNYLLEGDFRYGKNYKEVISYYKDIVPNAKVVRSHSVVSSTKILEEYYKQGFIYDLNTELPFSSGIEARPYKDWTGLIKIPYFWQENMSFEYGWDYAIDKFINNNYLKVLNFHPIHLFLNSASMDHYNSIRGDMTNTEKLKNNINTSSYGVRDFFIDLITRINRGDQ